MRIGFTNGCFDLFHEGHKHFLRECRKHCDYLIVAVNTDEYCKSQKGEVRPYDPLHTRMSNVADYADAVICFLGRADNLIMEIRPDVVFKGYDHTSPDFMMIRKPGWKEHGQWDKIQIIQIAELPGYSTTELANASQCNAQTRP